MDKYQVKSTPDICLISPHGQISGIISATPDICLISPQALLPLVPVTNLRYNQCQNQLKDNVQMVTKDLCIFGYGVTSALVNMLSGSAAQSLICCTVHIHLYWDPDDSDKPRWLMWWTSSWFPTMPPNHLSMPLLTSNKQWEQSFILTAVNIKWLFPRKLKCWWFWGDGPNDPSHTAQ